MLEQQAAALLGQQHAQKDQLADVLDAVADEGCLRLERAADVSASPPARRGPRDISNLQVPRFQPKPRVGDGPAGRPARRDPSPSRPIRPAEEKEWQRESAESDG